MYNDQSPGQPPNISRSNSVPGTTEEKTDSSRRREEELLSQLDSLRREKEALVEEARSAKAQQERQRKQLEAARLQQEQAAKFAAQTTTKKAEAAVAPSAEAQEELARLRREKTATQTALDEARTRLERETRQLMDDKRKMFVEIEMLKNAQEVEARKHRALWDRREEEVARARAEAAEASALRQRLEKSEEEALGRQKPDFLH